MKIKVEWTPCTPNGDRWRAKSAGITRGYVQRLRNGRIEAHCFGSIRRYNCTSLRDAGKHIVAYLNSVAPSKIP